MTHPFPKLIQKLLIDWSEASKETCAMHVSSNKQTKEKRKKKKKKERKKKKRIKC